MSETVPMYYYVCFFTTYTFIASVAIGTGVVRLLPFVAIEIVRGAVWIVAVSVLYIYLRFGLSAVQDFYAKLGLNPDWSLIYDTLVHFTPVIWAGGLPKTALGYIGGYALFLGWFITIRTTLGMPELYIKSISSNAYDQWAIAYLPVLLLISYGFVRMLKNDE